MIQKKNQKMKATDLNKLQITTEGLPLPQEDYGVTSPDGLVSVYFKDIEKRLIEHINKADYVVGCVAWLTHPDILLALAMTKGVSIIVQKEDWLRPDVNSKPGFKSAMKTRYAALPSAMTRFDTGLSGTTLCGMSACSSQTIEAVRCVGNLNINRSPASPRSHHKFVVFCKKLPTDADDKWGGNFEPYAVWTGSFNFTKNATMSFENAVVLRHPEVVSAYFKEYGQVAALSEPLDWFGEWASPEWRVGT